MLRTFSPPMRLTGPCNKVLIFQGQPARDFCRIFFTIACQYSHLDGNYSQVPQLYAVSFVRIVGYSEQKSLQKSEAPVSNYSSEVIKS